MKKVLARAARTYAWVTKPQNVTAIERVLAALTALYVSLHRAGVL